MSSSATREYEVEQKFALTNLNEITERLKELGFSESLSPKMVDWYWDDSTISLTSQDCWLRLREMESKGSCWQLKLRCNKSSTTADGDSTASATVYEEVAGPSAITKALTLLPASSDDSNKPTFSKDSDECLNLFLKENKLPEKLSSVEGAASAPVLMPFAVIETQRSSWIPATTSASKQEYATLKVDLDTATFGGGSSGSIDTEVYEYTVGEVEEVVHNQDDIANAKQRVEQFIEKLTGQQQQQQTVPVGKLEYYLIHHRPEHYQALVDGGILKYS